MFKQAYKSSARKIITNQILQQMADRVTYNKIKVNTSWSHVREHYGRSLAEACNAVKKSSIVKAMKETRTIEAWDGANQEEARRAFDNGELPDNFPASVQDTFFVDDDDEDIGNVEIEGDAKDPCPFEDVFDDDDEEEDAPPEAGGACEEAVDARDGADVRPRKKQT